MLCKAVASILSRVEDKNESILEIGQAKDFTPQCLNRLFCLDAETPHKGIDLDEPHLSSNLAHLKEAVWPDLAAHPSFIRINLALFFEIKELELSSCTDLQDLLLSIDKVGHL